MIVCRKTLVKIVFIITTVIILVAAYPGIRNMGLILYMGRANQKYWDRVTEVCSKNFEWIDQENEFALSLNPEPEYCVLTNRKNNNFVKFVFSSDGVNFRNDSEESLGWAYWSYNDKTQIFILEIEWFEDEGVFLKESLQIEEGTVLSFRGYK